MKGEIRETKVNREEMEAGKETRDLGEVKEKEHVRQNKKDT